MKTIISKLLLLEPKMYAILICLRKKDLTFRFMTAFFILLSVIDGKEQTFNHSLV